jgi:hypothetical protein
MKKFTQINYFLFAQTWFSGDKSNPGREKEIEKKREREKTH